MKTNKMPTTVILLFFSWLIAIAGLLLALAQIFILRPGGINLWINSAVILLGSLLMAIVIRVFANISQMIFDWKADMYNLARENKEIMYNLARENKEIMPPRLDTLILGLGKLNCDISEIRAFFEKIEKQLGLNKK